MRRRMKEGSDLKIRKLLEMKTNEVMGVKGEYREGERRRSGKLKE